MRGSRAGIVSMQPKQRVYEYEYFFARYFAKYCARKMKKSGKKVLVFSCAIPPLFAHSLSSAQGKCAYREFADSFILAAGIDQGNLTAWDIDHGVRVVFSKANNELAIVNLIGANEKRAAIELINLWSES